MKKYTFIYAIAPPDSGHPRFTKHSDDALKVWLNGELVHENWVERGVVEDDDRVKGHFKKGTNQLVLKIQNTYVGWGFCCRMLGQ